MAIQITCPDCQTSINVKSDLAGRTLKCPGCERELTEADASPPPPARPVVARRPREDEPRRRPVDEDRPLPRRRSDDEDDDDYDYDRRERPRRSRERKKTRSKGLPLLPLGIGAAVLILIGATVAIVYILTKDDGTGGAAKAFTPPAIKWQFQTVPGTALTVEMPQYAQAEKGNRANPFGETSVGLRHMIHTANGPLSLAASQLDGAVLQGPGGGDILDIIEAGAKANPKMRISDRSPVQGRRSLTVVVSDPELIIVQRYIQDGKTTFVLECTGDGISESSPEVRRFLDSPRFGK